MLTSGGIADWHTQDHPENLIDASKAKLNDYVYAQGSGLDHLSYPGTAKISVKESGPLETSLLVKSDAPGTNSIQREIKVYNGLSQVDLIDTILIKPTLSIRRLGHIAFPLNLPGGQVRLDSQFAVTRPELDQIPGANKNWFPVSRWADISNSELWRNSRHARCAADGSGRNYRNLRSGLQRGVDHEDRPDADALLLDFQQPLVHQL